MYPGPLAADMPSFGIKTFVCLQPAHEVEYLTPYEDHVRQSNVTNGFDWEPTFINFPIPDFGTVDDEAIEKFADTLIERINNGDVMVIHCKGGHGRSGLISAILLGKLYGHLSADDCLKFVQAVHDTRQVQTGGLSPETSGQRDQVKRLLTKHTKASL
jgi:protein-tyrosine phosphatase